MSQKEENKYMYGPLSNAKAIDSTAYGMGGLAGSSPTKLPAGSSGSKPHSKKNSPLIGIAIIVALLVLFAVFFGFLHW